LACCLNCHDKHELIELYTKRNFQCDCGVKTGSVACQLDPFKKAASNNQYNQNFGGVYCECKRPYPDPENNTNDEMIQCILCEDWYHSLHLKGKVPNADAYAEMTCGGCMTKNKFLYDYSGLSVVSVEPEKGDESLVNVSSLDDSSTNNNDDNPTSSKKMRMSDEACQRPHIDTTDNVGNALFWQEGWRTKLCKCEKCEAMYKAAGVEFLTDMDDTTNAYEEKGKTNREPPAGNYAASMDALSTLPRGKIKNLRC
jgi:E3 ubiquitin-protein ligase UBR7